MLDPQRRQLVGHGAGLRRVAVEDVREGVPEREAHRAPRLPVARSSERGRGCSAVSGSGGGRAWRLGGGAVGRLPVSVRFGTPRRAPPRPLAGRTAIYPFYGERQAGIVTPAQDRLAFASLNLLAGTTRGDLRVLLRDWTAAAARMTRDSWSGDDTNLDDPPLDTGEAIGSPVAGLTITIGYGPSLFDDRFGLSAAEARRFWSISRRCPTRTSTRTTSAATCAFRPARTIRSWPFTPCGTSPDSGWESSTTTRWSSASAGPRPPARPSRRRGTCSASKTAPGTSRPQQTDLLDDYVWVGKETDQPWMEGGSYLVARRIQIFIENWDRDVLATSRTSSAGPRRPAHR